MPNKLQDLPTANVSDDANVRYSEIKSNPKDPIRQKRRLYVVAALLLLVLFAGAGTLWAIIESDSSENNVESSIVNTDILDTQLHLEENPIDFAALHKVNSDICGWIVVPGTSVDYPICQSSTDDTFYLDHNWEKQYSPPGAIYIELANSRAFTDSITVAYGHSGYDDTMFSTLHYFSDVNFFSAHDTFYIYMPGHIYTYQIVSAYMYDDRHILNTFNFADQTVVNEYFAQIMDPASLVKNVRSDVVLEPDDRIVQLSTCMTDLTMVNNRYLVTGVLVEDQPTKAG